MAKRNVKKIVEDTTKKINPRYDVTVDDVKTLKNISLVNDVLDVAMLVNNAFKYGYAMGQRAPREK